MAFLAAPNKNRQPVDLQQIDFDLIPERFLLSVRTKSITEFFVLKIASIVRFCSVSTSFFILKLSANAFYDFHLGMVNPFISIP